MNLLRSGEASLPQQLFSATALPLVLALVAAAGLSALWAAFAVASSGLAGWMGVVAGIDAALLLRLSGRHAGRPRAAASLFVFAVSVVASAYVVGAARMGGTLGMRPWESLERLSPGLIQLYLSANDGPLDWFWLAVGALLAWRLAR